MLRVVAAFARWGTDSPNSFVFFVFFCAGSWTLSKFPSADDGDVNVALNVLNASELRV
jgi:hypothetical protein